MHTVIDEEKFQPGGGDGLIGGTPEITLQAAPPSSVALTLVWQPLWYLGNKLGPGHLNGFPILSMSLISV